MTRIRATGIGGELDQLKDNIRKEINNIPTKIFPSIMRNMTVHMLPLIGRRGGYTCMWSERAW